jgi:hypothetical protein
MRILWCRGVAQPGSASALGARTQLIPRCLNASRVSALVRRLHPDTSLKFPGDPSRTVSVASTKVGWPASKVSSHSLSSKLTTTSPSTSDESASHVLQFPKTSAADHSSLHSRTRQRALDGLLSFRRETSGTLVNPRPRARRRQLLVSPRPRASKEPLDEPTNAGEEMEMDDACGSTGQPT